MYILCALWTNHILILYFSGGASTTQSKKNTGSKRGRGVADDENDGGGDDDADDDDDADADADAGADAGADGDGGDGGGGGDDDDDDDDVEVSMARFSKGQKAFLVDGNGSVWGTVYVEDGEYSQEMPEGWEAKPHEYPLVRGGDSMKITTGWTDTPLFKYVKKSDALNHGVYKINHQSFERTMTPKLLKQEDFFIIDVQHLSVKKPEKRKIAKKNSSTVKPVKTKAKS